MRIEEILYGNAGGAISVSYCTPGTMHFSPVFRPMSYTTQHSNVTLRQKTPSHQACLVATGACERVDKTMYYTWYRERDGRGITRDQTVKIKTVFCLQTEWKKIQYLRAKR